MYELKVREHELARMPLDIPGVSMKVLFEDQATGAMTVLTGMEAGAVIPAHFHTHADETVFVLEGEFVEDGDSYGPGAYFVGKAKSHHGPHRSPQGATLLTHFSAQLDFQLV